MKKIVIFGATGDTGSYFTDYCRSHADPEKYEIVAVGSRDTAFFSEMIIDMRDREVITFIS